VGESFFPISTDRVDSVVVDAWNEGILVMFVNPTWFSPALAPIEMPVGLSHIDSDFCWCDPIIEVDDSGHEVVLHRQVTWN
jgi:hypothetical protein